MAKHSDVDVDCSRRLRQQLRPSQHRMAIAHLPFRTAPAEPRSKMAVAFLSCARAGPSYCRYTPEFLLDDLLRWRDCALAGLCDLDSNLRGTNEGVYERLASLVLVGDSIFVDRH